MEKPLNQVPGINPSSCFYNLTASP
ncbi:hypothetical protein NC652_033577 [Populus alba x Populus x berolinensis]|uniref:Uncharacterized protein n=1 Tax=Populus alba x Populus x berolinensis TaxID=444605 RepID=A0AAD6PZE4_9ROSI|nr:hypothetical protein NC652_033577 [Populus alba x Populus x berolinensis]KAJ6973206.1 hypothetical protein NC653_033517 [Populus alba x Populus x berolinensis]